MSLAIGLRFYRITVRRKGDQDQRPIGPGGDPCDFYEYTEGFIKRRIDPTEETSEPRTWYFDPLKTNSIRAHHGHINYGTHGFESKLKDAKTKKPKYDRQASDLEEIPLYFQVWCPSESTFAIAAFQSFGGRSCVGFVRAAMANDFRKLYPEYVLGFKALVPAQALVDEAPVKSLTFIKPHRSSDPADRMLGRQPDELDYQLTVRAKARNAFLGRFKDLNSTLGANKDGLVEFDGREYEGVRADVKIGKKRRSVGLFGFGVDGGLIDVSDDVKREISGHPQLQSISTEVDELMEELYGKMKT